jgi:hypothetical protein
MKNIKITRSAILLALTAILIAGVFLIAWLFGDNTCIFNDTKYSDGSASFRWVHVAINVVVVIGYIVLIILYIGEFVNDKSDRPFKFIYDKDEYNYRRSRRNEDDKEEAPAKPIQWKRWVFYIVLLFCIVNVFKFGKTIYKQSVFMYNTSKKYNNTYQQKVEEKLGFYDKLWKTYQTKAQITNMNKDVFVEVTKIIMANVADGQNLSWKWISRYPDIDYNQFTEFYADLSNYIEKQREGYFSIEKTCQLIANQNNTMLDTFPNNIYNRALKLQRIKFEYGFLSDSTNHVFATKIENLK